MTTLNVCIRCSNPYKSSGLISIHSCVGCSAPLPHRLKIDGKDALLIDQPELMLLLFQRGCEEYKQDFEAATSTTSASPSTSGTLASGTLLATSKKSANYFYPTILKTLITEHIANLPSICSEFDQVLIKTIEIISKNYVGNRATTLKYAEYSLAACACVAVIKRCLLNGSTEISLNRRKRHVAYISQLDYIKQDLEDARSPNGIIPTGMSCNQIVNLLMIMVPSIEEHKHMLSLIKLDDKNDYQVYDANYEYRTPYLLHNLNIPRSQLYKNAQDFSSCYLYVGKSSRAVHEFCMIQVPSLQGPIYRVVQAFQADKVSYSLYQWMTGQVDSPFNKWMSLHDAIKFWEYVYGGESFAHLELSEACFKTCFGVNVEPNGLRALHFLSLKFDLSKTLVNINKLGDFICDKVKRHGGVISTDDYDKMFA